METYLYNISKFRNCKTLYSACNSSWLKTTYCTVSRLLSIGATMAETVAGDLVGQMPISFFSPSMPSFCFPLKSSYEVRGSAISSPLQEPGRSHRLSLMLFGACVVVLNFVKWSWMYSGRLLLSVKPSEKWQPVTKFGDQIHLVPTFFRVGGNVSHRVRPVLCAVYTFNALTLFTRWQKRHASSKDYSFVKWTKLQKRSLGK